MSLVFNMVGGGSGKLNDTDAVLIVTVPTSSTVTATKGAVTLTPTMWVKAADNTLDCAIFSIPASQFDTTTPWTVMATLGTNMASTRVLIVTNKEYEASFSFNVPAGYQEVVYIQSAGSQFINSGISLGSSFKIVSTIWLPQIVGSSENPLFSIWTNSANYWNLFIPNNERKFDLYASGHHYFQTLTLNEEYYYAIERSNDIWISTLNNAEIVSTISMGNTNTTPLKFLARGDGVGPSYWRLGPTKVYKNGELVGDFYPCYRLSDSVAGMWDKVSESFFQNAGSGSFIVGPDVN